MAQDVKVVKTVFEVDSSQVSKASKEFDNLSKSIDKTGKELTETSKQAEIQGKKTKDAIDNSKQSVDKFGSSIGGIGGMVAGAFSIGAIMAFGKAVIDITSQVQKYRAVLTNTLGSQDLADLAMGMISDTAIKTNFSVMELTDTYIKFANRGLKLTSGEMLKLADIANSTGKSIDQLTEATLDAFTGENERLKEFGITAKKTGETTQYTFKGVTTEVKNTQEAIKAYLLGLGELNGVMGSTDAISKTLGGQISNLGDKWDKLLISMGNSTGTFVSYTIDAFSGMLDTISSYFQTVESVAKEKSSKLIEGQNDSYKKIYENVINISKKGNKDVSKELLNTQNQLIEGNLINLKNAENQLKKIQEDFSLVKEDNTNLASINPRDKNITSLIIAENDLSAVGKTGQNYVDLYINQLAEVNKLKVESSIINEEYKKSLKSVTGVETETAKQKDARIKAIQSQFKLELDLLQAEEKRALTVSKNAKEDSVKQLAIQQDYNEKRIGIYSKYDATLTKQDKSAKKDLILNTTTLGVERYDLELANLIKFQDEELRLINEGEERKKKNEQNLRKDNQSNANIIQSNINIAKYTELKALYENDKISFEDKVKQKEEIELRYQSQSLEANKEYLNKRLESEELNAEETAKVKEDLAKTEVQLNEEKNKKIEEDNKKSAENQKEIIKALGQFGKEAVATYFTYRSRVLSAELDELQRNKESELAKIEETENGKAKVYTKAETQKKAIEEKYRIEQSNLKRQQFELQKQQALTEIAINTAVAVSKIWAVSGPTAPLFTGLAIASGALQAGLVLSQPTPKFAKGGKINGKKHSQGGEIVEVEHDEWIINANASNKYNGLLKAINDGSLERKGITPELASKLLNGGMSSPIVNVNNDNLAKELRAMPKNAISIDENGFNRYIESQNQRTQILNKRYGV